MLFSKDGKMGRIIGNMVVRNEAPHYLDQVLERLSKQVDEIVVTDDASTDNTVEVARQYTDKINILPEPMFSVHEGKLRQQSWNFLESVTQPTSEDWILAIDADELLFEQEDGLMRKHITDDGLEVISIAFYHMWTPTHFRVDGGWRPHGSTRLFRYDYNGKFRDSQIASGSEPEFVRWKVANFRDVFLATSGLKIKHLSYIKDEDKQAKYERYMALDQGNFHALSHIKSIADPISAVSLVEWAED